MLVRSQGAAASVDVWVHRPEDHRTAGAAGIVAGPDGGGVCALQRVSRKVHIETKGQENRAGGSLAEALLGR